MARAMTHLERQPYPGRHCHPRAGHQGALLSKLQSGSCCHDSSKRALYAPQPAPRPQCQRSPALRARCCASCRAGSPGSCRTCGQHHPVTCPHILTHAARTQMAALKLALSLLKIVLSQPHLRDPRPLLLCCLFSSSIHDRLSSFYTDVSPLSACILHTSDIV